MFLIHFSKFLLVKYNANSRQNENQVNEKEFLYYFSAVWGIEIYYLSADFIVGNLAKTAAIRLRDKCVEISSSGSFPVVKNGHVMSACIPKGERQENALLILLNYTC